MSCLLPWRTNRQPFLRANRSNSLQVIPPTVTNIAQKCDTAKLLLLQYSSHDLTLGGINLNFSHIENNVCSGKVVAFLNTEELSLFVVFVPSVLGTKKEPASRPQCSNYLLCGAVKFFAKAAPFGCLCKDSK